MIRKNLLKTEFSHVLNSTMSIMSKKGNSKSKNNTKQPEVSASTDDEAIKSARKDKGLLMTILAKPGAKQNTITGMTPEGICVQIAAPPVDGEANQELIKFVAKTLGLRKSDVTLETGSKSRTKMLLVENISIEAAKEKIQNAIDNG